MNETQQEKADWTSIGRVQEYMGYVFPKVSIVIPSLNNSSEITLTLESLLNQDYPDLEVIIVDAGSTDRTLETLKYFYDARIKICTVPLFNRYEMLNKGISLAVGEYVNFLFPGDFYIHPLVLRDMMALAIDHQRPYLAYGAGIIRGESNEVTILFRDFTLELMKMGLQPTNLQACWFKMDTFKIIGKFNPQYTSRGGFDLLCRFIQNALNFISTTHVVTDYDLRHLTSRIVYHYIWDTWAILYLHFGFMTALRWALIQKDTGRLLRLWFKRVRGAFVANKIEI